MKNTYEIKDDKVYIQLTQGQTMIIDLDDLEKVRKHNSRWCAKRLRMVEVFYCYGNIKINNKWKSIIFHRWLLDLTNPKIQVDHIDHDTLNNTRENLRICTQSENVRNRYNFKNGKSKYKGLTWRKNEGKWNVRIQYNKKRISLGYFDNEIEAAKAYDIKAKELFKEFAILNFPEE